MSPDIASSLEPFGFEIVHIKKLIKEIPQFQNRPEGIPDPELYEYCRDNNYVFITHDYSARKQHEADIKAARIHVVWIRGKTEEVNGESATWRFFKVIVRSIDEIKRKVLSSYGAIHFRISRRTGSSPEIVWTQHPSDKSRRKPEKKK